jgi:hypothetical protein
VRVNGIFPVLSDGSPQIAEGHELLRNSDNGLLVPQLLLNRLAKIRAIVLGKSLILLFWFWVT